MHFNSINIRFVTEHEVIQLLQAIVHYRAVIAYFHLSFFKKESFSTFSNYMNRIILVKWP